MKDIADFFCFVFNKSLISVYLLMNYKLYHGLALNANKICLNNFSQKQILSFNNALYNLENYSREGSNLANIISLPLSSKALTVALMVFMSFFIVSILSDTRWKKTRT